MKNKKYISLFLLVVWSIVIFVLSHQTGVVSKEESTYFVESVLKINNDLHNLIRELMHFLEFFIFGILLLNTLYSFNIKKSIIKALIISVIYSLTDELHQLFISGRAFEILDIILDVIGAFIGIYIIKIVYKNKKV